jgi:hypothetical protein
MRERAYLGDNCEFEISPIRSAAVAGILTARLGSCTRIANVLYLKAAKGRRE